MLFANVYICGFLHAALLFNQVLSSVMKLIHSPLCCKPTMQTYCGLTNCTSNSPETGFSFSYLRLVKSWVSCKFSILHSYFHRCLSFRGWSSRIRNKLVKNRSVSYSPARGVTKGSKEASNQFPIPRASNHYGGAESLRGAPNDCERRRKVPTISQILSSIQYICFRKTSGSNMGVPNLLLVPDAI